MFTLARLVRLAAGLIVAFIVAGILLYVLEANRDNWLVGAVFDVAEFFVEPFRNIFSLDDRKLEVALNWGIGAALYGLAGSLIAALLVRLAAGGRRLGSGRIRHT